VQREIKNTNNQEVKKFANKQETPMREASQSAQRTSSSVGSTNMSASAKQY